MDPQSFKRRRWFDVDDDDRDLLVNYWRVPKTEAAAAFIKALIDEALSFEADKRLRKRCRNAKTHERFTAGAQAILADVCYRALTNPGQGVMVSRSNRMLVGGSRYRPSFVTPALRSTLDLLSHPELDLVVQQVGEAAEGGSGFRTALRAASRLVDRIREASIAASDFGVTHGEELLVLKRFSTDGRRRKELVEYEDDADTRRMRAQLSDLNGFLDAADIEVDRAALDEGCDPSRRRLRRHFACGSFRKGGRISGGFWQEMSKKDRRRYLRIQGEEVAECDYGSFVPRIAYGLVGAQPPDRDLYAIPGFEGHRSGVKIVMNSLFWADGPLERFPKAMRDGGYFSSQDKVGDVVSAVKEAHPAITSLFEVQAGYRLMFEESEILFDVLERLESGGVVALPIYDAVLVGQSHTSAACEAMREAFWDRFGHECPVRVESS